MGPDEFHDAYPGRDRPGVDNNAYTNVMAAWTLTKALATVEALPERRRSELLDLLGVTRAELERWDHVSRRLRLSWHDNGILSQFDGYERLEEFAWDDYAKRYGDISRLDRILEAEADTPNRYKLSKQADVLMLFYLLSADELYELLDRLGYPRDPALIPRNVDYYLRRTSSRLNAVEGRPFVGARPVRPSTRLALPAGGPGRRPAGRAGRHNQRRPPPRRDGRHHRPAATRLHRNRDPRRRAVARPCLPDELAELRFRLRYRDHYGVNVTVSAIGSPSADSRARCRCESRTKA